MQAGRLFEKSSDEHQRRTEHYKAVKRDAEFTFEPPHQNDNGRPMLRGHAMPPPEEIVLHMNRVSSQPLPDEAMRGTYGFLSNYVHPTPYPLRELFAVREPGVTPFSARTARIFSGGSSADPVAATPRRLRSAATARPALRPASNGCSCMLLYTRSRT
jgi:hypothetical protein